MKNRFGFIPIVLPAIVMVLIIGLINMTGPQTPVAEAQTATRLMDLDVEYNITGQDNVYKPAELKSGSHTGFSPTRASYSATVEHDVGTVRITPKADYVNQIVRVAAGTGVTVDRNILTAAPAADGSESPNFAFGNVSKRTVTVMVYDDNSGDTTNINPNPNDQYDEGVDKQTATYTITLTEKALDLSPGQPALDTKVPHLAGSNGLQVSGQDATNFENAPGTDRSSSLARYNKGNFTGWNNRIKTWYITVPHEDNRVTVTATGGTYTGANNQNATYNVSISPDDAGNAAANVATSTYVISSGGKKTFTITASAAGGSTSYKLTIEREKPVINDLDVTPRAWNTAGTAKENGTPQEDIQGRDPLAVSFAYENVEATVSVGTGDNDSTDGTGKVLTITPADADTNVQGHQVALRPGDNKVNIKVDHYLQKAGQATSSIGVTSTANYTLTLTREAPKLANVSITDGTGEVTVSPTFSTTRESEEYDVSVDFNVGRVTVQHLTGPKPPDSKEKAFTVTYEPKTDRDTGQVGHQVDLKPGENTIKITVKSAVKSTSKRTYTFNVTRDETTLTDLDHTCVDYEGESVAPCTTTPETFAPATKNYTADVSYAAETTTVTATPEGGANVKFTSPRAMAVGPLSSPLRVGNNVFTVEAGTSAVGPGNTTTYKLTVDRNEPEPVIQFKLYDAAGDEIDDLPDDTQLPLHLISAARRYTMDKDDGFTVNVKSVRMNAHLGDGVNPDDVKISVGRVSIPTDTLGNFTNYHTMELAEGTNTMAFEVEFRQHPDDQSLSGRSVHTLTIAREGNSVPTFRPNHGLGQTLIEMVDQVEVDTSTTVLPHGRNGNGDLSYTLVGKGGNSMPEGLEMHDPVGRNMDGWIYGAPNIEPRSAYADHTLVLTVADSDDITGKSDQTSVEFTLRIYRDEEAKRAAQTPATTGPAQLTGIGVYYIDPANDPMTSKTCKGQLAARSGSAQASKDCGMLVPSFDPATMSYTVTIPTDVETVDVHAEAGSSTTTVTLRGPGSPNLGAGSGVHDNRHEWNGYRVVNGGAAQTDNIYILTATQGTDSNEYRVIIRRETDTPVKFATADKADLSFRLYEGIKPDGNKMTGSAKIWLPEAMVGSGNGATSTWRYSLDRTDTGDEVEKKNFEGLMLNDALTERKDGGGIRLGGGDDVPELDSDAQGRRKSDKSGAPGVYTVRDADLNKAASDGDSINVSVTVYRDVSLDYYVVGDTTVDNSLGLDSRKISNAWSAGDLNDDYSDWVYTWDADDKSGAIFIDAYTFPVSHTATEATLNAVANGGTDATVSYSPADADATQSGHQVALGRGDNVVTVTVSNGDVQATHKINLVRPGLQASSIRVDTDRGASTPAMVTLIQPDGSKGFDRDVYTYTATVESWIETLQIRASAVDPTATVSVNLDAINTAIGFAEVRLNDPQGAEGSTTEFRIGITNPTPTDTPGLYLLTVTRKGNDVPTFSATQSDVLVKNGEAMKLVLPKASGGNGTVTHNLTEAELPNGVTYDKSTRTISGTPQLTVDQGYESDFVLTYTAVDSDSDTSAADSDSQTFTLTVTNGDVPAEPAPPGLGDDENYNTLRSLVVSYNRPGKAEMVANLVPEFTSDNSGPYTAIVPHDAENVYVTPSLSDAGAALWIDNISQQNARKVKILSTTTIMVEHTTHSDLGAMTYTVNLSPTSDSVPSFAGKSIDDMVLLAGEDMGVTQLPMADGGNGTVSYTLKDHGGRDIPRRGIGGIKFDASSRTLYGTPVLNADADKTIYRLSYQATDQDGDASEVLGFMVTVCRSEDMPGCDITGNPGYTPMDLVVRRSGSSATLTWTPGDDATKQFVAALIVNPTSGSIMSTLRLAGDDGHVAGNARRHVFTDLADASMGSYVYLVVGYDDMDSFRDANGMHYRAVASE